MTEDHNIDQQNEANSQASHQYFSFFLNISNLASISTDHGQPPRSFQETMDMVLKGIPIPCKMIEEKLNDQSLSVSTKAPIKKPWEQNV